MYIEIYFLIQLITLITLIVLYRKDYIAPEVIYSASMVLSSFSYIQLKDYWGRDISKETFEVMLASSCIFIFIALVSRFFFFKTSNNSVSGYSIKLSNIYLVGSFLGATINIIYTVSIIGNVGSVLEYKELLSFKQLENVFLLKQLNKIILAYVYIAIYIFVNNVVLRHEKIAQQKMLLCNIVYCVISVVVVSLSRQSFIEYLLYSMVIYFYLKNGSDATGNSVLTIFKVLLCCFLCVPFFYYIAGYIGRDFERISSYGAFFYVGLYLSSGINFFNVIIMPNPAITEYFGQSSLSAIYYNFLIGKVLPDNVVDMTYHEFSTEYGNTVTIFGRWYEDWGTSGVLIMISLIAWFYSYFYYNNVRNNSDNKFYGILYAKIVLALAWAGYDDRIAPLLSVNIFSILFLMYLIYMLIVIKKIKIRIKV